MHNHDHKHDHGKCDVCSASDPDASSNSLESQLDKLIEKSGHAVLMIMPKEGSDDPGFAYTAGLSEANWPEIIISGICGDQGNLIINEAITWLKKRDIRPTDGMLLEEAVNVPLKLRRINPQDAMRYARLAVDRHIMKGGQPISFEALQLLWPDILGKFPDEVVYSKSGLPPQNIL